MVREKVNTEFVEEQALKRTYQASLLVMKRVAPFIPQEASNLRQDLIVTTMDIPRSLAAAVDDRVFAPTLSKLSDAIVLLSFCRDLHGQWINAALCESVVETYQQVSEALREVS